MSDSRSIPVNSLGDKLKKKALLFSALVAGIVLSATPAMADGDQITVRETAEVGQSDQVVTDQLHALEGSQTATEIDALISLGEPVAALYDVETEEYTAAVLEQPTFTTFAISFRISCASTDACLTQGNLKTGYYGTGAATLNQSGVTALKAGSKITSWGLSTGKVVDQQYSWVTTHFSTPVKVVNINRANQNAA